MLHESDPLKAEQLFFRSLLEGNVNSLDHVLTDDFILIEVMQGSVIEKASLLEVIRSGQLKFEIIEPTDTRTRFYPGTALVTGATHMKGQIGNTMFTTRSRYTHVYVEQQGGWRLATAQGTPIS